MFVDYLSWDPPTDQLDDWILELETNGALSIIRQLRKRGVIRAVALRVLHRVGHDPEKYDYGLQAETLAMLASVGAKATR